MSEFATFSPHKRVTFYLPDETESSSPMLGATTVILLMSLVPIPLTFFLNTQQWMQDPVTVLLVGMVVLCLIVLLPHSSLRKMKESDPILRVVSLFMFSSAVDLLIAFENDDIIADFVAFLEEGEPHFKTAHWTMLSYWDGLVHFGIWLMILAAISWGENYRSAGLYWVGSLTNSTVVFLLGSISGKFGLRWLMILCLPYLLIPLWIGYKLLKQPRTNDEIILQEQSSKSIWKRPGDCIFILYFCSAGMIDIFRGLVVLGCQENLVQEYTQQIEPYLLDPSGYPKVQMLMYLFYFVPYYFLAVYGLLNSQQTWVADWSLIYAGAAAQGQFTHIGSSHHSRTPFKLRVPHNSKARIAFWVVNGSLFLVPQLFAYRQSTLDEASNSQDREKTE